MCRNGGERQDVALIDRQLQQSQSMQEAQRSVLSFSTAPLTCRMSRNRKYVFATSWNCSNKLIGRKVTMLYLEVMMQLLWRKVRGDISLDYSYLLSSSTIASGAGGGGGEPYRVLELLVVLPVVGSEPSLLLCRSRNRELAER